MANPSYQTHTTTGAKDPVLLDWTLTPFAVSVGVELASGTATFKVQYTLDDLNSSSPTPYWFDDANIPAGTTATDITNYVVPIRAVRLNIAAISGTVNFKVVQGLQRS